MTNLDPTTSKLTLKEWRAAVLRRLEEHRSILKKFHPVYFSPSLKTAENVAGSAGVAPLHPGEEAPLRADFPLTGFPAAAAPGAINENLVSKQRPTRDDENKGQADHLSSSSGADIVRRTRHAPVAKHTGQKRHLRTQKRDKQS